MLKVMPRVGTRETGDRHRDGKSHDATAPS